MKLFYFIRIIKTNNFHIKQFKRGCPCTTASFEFLYRDLREKADLDFYVEVFENHFFGFGVPQSFVGFAAFVQFQEEWIFFAEFCEVFDGGHGHIELGIGQFFATWDFWQVECRFSDAIDAADVGDHDGRVDDAFGSQGVGFDEVVVVTACRAHNVGAGVVAVVEVDVGAEVFVRRAGEKVHAAVEGQKFVAQFGDGADRRVDEDVVVAVAVGELHQVVIGCIHVGCVDVDEFDAVLSCIFRRYDFFGPGDAGIVDVGDDDALRFVFKMNAVADGTEAHGAAAAEDDDVAAFFGTHRMVVIVFIRMVVGMIAADDAAHGFTQGRFKETVAFVGHEGAEFHDFVRENAVRAVAAEEFVRVTRGSQTAFVVQGRLLGEAHTRFELVLPFLADFDDDAGKFVACDDRMRIHVLGRAFMFLTLFDEFVC